jgi:tripartite-type tricarboxylate transporter receptor subunit TctC
MSRTRMVSILVVLSFLVFGYTSGPFAQTYPERPITLVLPMAPGDGIDVAGRAMADELSRLLRVPIVPLNKPGASATAGTDFVAKSKKDGYTILFTNNASVISTRILQPENVPYDPFKDLTPLALVTQNPALMVVRGDAPYKNFKEMVEYAKKNPGKIRCSTMGVGSVGHFDVEIVNMVVGTDIEMVPFKGASPSVTAALGGHVEAVASAIGPLISHMRSGALKAILSSIKISEFADVPTLKELGYQQELLGIWFAFFAPADIPPEVRATLVSAIEKVAKDPSVASKLANLGMVQDFEPPDKLTERMRGEYKIVEEIAKKSGMIK